MTLTPRKQLHWFCQELTKGGSLMEHGYTVTQLADIAGISPRTLRYYDQIGLLVPRRAPDSGYRIYGKEEVDVLWQILFFRRMGLELSTIEGFIKDPAFN